MTTISRSAASHPAAMPRFGSERIPHHRLTEYFKEQDARMRGNEGKISRQYDKGLLHRNTFFATALSVVAAAGIGAALGFIQNNSSRSEVIGSALTFSILGGFFAYLGSYLTNLRTAVQEAGEKSSRSRQIQEYSLN